MIIAFLCFHRLFNPLKKITYQVERLGNLDLKHTGELDKLAKIGGEVGMMARSVWQVQTKLAEVVMELKDESEHLVCFFEPIEWKCSRDGRDGRTD